MGENYVRKTLLAASLLLTSIQTTWGAAIDLYSDPAGTNCNLTISVGSTGRFFVCGRLPEYQPPGFDGAEFRITGLPAGWQVVSVQPNPAANVVLGSPMGNGTNIAFPNLQVGACVPLFTIDIEASTPVNDAALRVTGHATPANPNFTCPYLTRDLGPAFAQVCATPGGQLLLNSGTTCTVGVRPATWSALKTLYN